MATSQNRKRSMQTCQIVAVGKRRDGGTRFWCLRHQADATAKYGRRAAECRAAHLPPITANDTLSLDLDKYKGGVALWGAVPAVYDTTTYPMDRGIHVHARHAAAGEKEMDRTVRALRMRGDRLPAKGIMISELDAIYYMVASIFKYKMKHVVCTFCGHGHLDRDWFSVHPHSRHLCAGCGRHFRDTDTAIGNPICGVRDAYGFQTQPPAPPNRTLDIRQRDYPGGIQVWGSNPAFIWTSPRAEEEGVHVHAFDDKGRPVRDETYSRVTIDGVTLDPVMVRTLMAQRVMPSLKNRIRAIECSFCQKLHFSTGTFAFTPVAKHQCKRCRREFSAKGRLRKTIGNPLLDILRQLSSAAPRPPQNHDLGLLPETL